MEATTALPKTATAISRPTSFQLDEFYDDLLENGSIRLLSNKKVRERPFPGLRPYKASEFQLFRGRDGQAEALVNRLKRNHFLAVIGSSGTGKSSLVRAGLIPHLLGGYFPEAGKHWDIAICRPGHDPLENLSIALARIKSRSNDKEKILLAYDEVAPEINDNIYGILEVNEQLHSTKESGEKKNLLIIVDQFEELFRFNRDDLNNPGIEAHFVNLLLKSSADASTSVYVIITMRSEFLGDSVKYRGLPEAINEGQYLVPQLSRTELRDVIEGPIKLAGKKIEPGLVEMLINEIEQSKLKKNLDQLPILQHTLMRTFEQASTKATANEITEADYEACGGMEKALANHAEAKYRALGQKSNRESFDQKIAKLVFQAITDSSTDQKGGRRPTELEIIHAIAKSLPASPEEVNRVIDTFRDTETSFIMPPINTPLFPQLIIDISHESLMRQWQRLREWANEEAEAAQKLASLMQAQRLYQKEEKELLKGKELSPILQWYKSFNPQPAWAERHDKRYQEGFDYLEASARAEKKKKTLAWVLSTFALIAVLGGLITWNKDQKKREADRREKRENFVYQSKEARDKDDLLKASLLLAEAIAMGEEDDTSYLATANSYLPVFFLQNYFQNETDIDGASFSNTADTVFLFNQKNNQSFVWSLKDSSFVGKKEGNLAVTAPVRQDEDIQLQLFNYWGVHKDSSGSWNGTIMDDQMELKVKVPKNFYLIYSLTESPSGNFAFSWSDTAKSLSQGSIWDLKNQGKQVGTTMLHTNQIYGGAFNQRSDHLVTWESESSNLVRVFRKITPLTVGGDLDFPKKDFPLLVKVATGAQLDKDGKLIPVTLVDWNKLLKEWKGKASAHYQQCQYKGANYWAHCYANQ